MSIKTVLVLFALVSFTAASKVLIHPWGLYKNSAQGILERLAVFLRDNAYDVHLLVYENYTNHEDTRGMTLMKFQRPTGYVNDDVNKTFPLEEYLETSQVQVVLDMYAVSYASCESILADKELMETLLQENYDLLVYEILDVCQVALASYLDVPTIGVVLFLFQLKMRQQENPYPMSYLPISSTDDPLAFGQRLKNFLFCLPFMLLTQYQLSMEEELALKFSIESKPLDSFFFHFGGYPIQLSTPTLPDMIYTDDFFVRKPTGQPIPEELVTFIDGSGDHGLIIVSFGSMISDFGKFGPIFANAFEGLPQHVLWRYTGDRPRILPRNVKLVDWLPRQQDLIAHPKTKLLITHGGWNSVHEALYSGVPMLVCPVNNDQFLSASAVAGHLKMGKRVDLKTVDATLIRTLIEEILNDTSFKDNAVRNSQLFRDKPMKSGDQVLYWVDYIIRHRGVSHLRPLGSQLPWYKFYQVDVVLYLSLHVILVIGVFHMLCRWKKRSLGTLPKCSKYEENTKIDNDGVSH